MSQTPMDKLDLMQIATDLVMATQKATMHMLEAELQGVAQLLPRADLGPTAHQPTQAEIEDGFDNMPV